MNANSEIWANTGCPSRWGLLGGPKGGQDFVTMSIRYLHRALFPLHVQAFPVVHHNTQS